MLSTRGREAGIDGGGALTSSLPSSPLSLSLPFSGIPSPSLPFPSLSLPYLFPSLPSPPFLSLSLPLEVGPLKPARGLGKCCLFP